MKIFIPLKTLVAIFTLVFFVVFSFSSVRAETEAELQIEKAMRGDPIAQFVIGRMYLHGAEVFSDNSRIEQDIEKGKMWLLKAGQSNNPDAFYWLGSMYFEGIDVEEDKCEASRWLQKAEKILLSEEKNKQSSWFTSKKKTENLSENIAEIQYMLGESHFQECMHPKSSSCLPGIRCGERTGSCQNFKLAAKYFQDAALRGNHKAAHGLAFMHHKGKGVPENYVEATKWYLKAVEAGNRQAQLQLADLYMKRQKYMLAHMWFNISSVSSGDCLNSKRSKEQIQKLNDILKPEEIERAQQMASDWVKNFNE